MGCSFYGASMRVLAGVLCGCSLSAVEVRVQGISDQEFCNKIKELGKRYPNVSDLRKQIAMHFPSKEVVVSKAQGVIQVKLYNANVVTQIKVVDCQKKLPKKALKQIEQIVQGVQKVGRPVDRYKLNNMRIQLSYTLRAQMGYKNPRVNHKIQNGILQIAILPGDQELVDKVSILLPKQFLQLKGKLNKSIIIKTNFWNKTPFVTDILETQKSALLKTLHGMGYKDARVAYSVVRKEQLTVNYFVQPGKRYVINKVVWSGEWPTNTTKDVAAELRKQPHLLWLSDKNVRLLCKGVTERLRKAKCDQEVSHSVHTDQGSGNATLTFRLNPPEYWTVGCFDVVGNKKTYIDTVHRVSGIYPGDVVTPTRMRDFHKRSRVHFADVKVERSNAQRTKLFVVERPGHEMVYGYGQASYNAYDGLDFGVGVEWRDLNFCGLAIPIQYNIALKDTGYQLSVGLNYPYPLGLNANLYTTIDVQQINAERLLSSIFRRGQTSIIPSFVTLSCKNETGIRLPISDKFSAESYVAVKFEQYGLTQYSLSQSAANRIDGLGISNKAMQIVNHNNLKYLLTSYARNRSTGLALQVESIVERIEEECGSGDARKLRRLINGIIALPFLSHKVFEEQAFPVQSQALLTVGNRFVYSDLDDDSSPSTGYQVGCDVSATTGTTSFSKLTLSGVKYIMINEDRSVAIRAKVGKLFGNQYWINNFGMHDFPSTLIDYEPASGIISPYRVGGGTGANVSIVMPLLSKELFDLKLFSEAGCVWDSGLDVNRYNIFGDEFSLNFAPGIAMTLYLPMLPPMTFSIGLPQIYGDARCTSFAEVLGIHCGFKFGGSY